MSQRFPTMLGAAALALCIHAVAIPTAIAASPAKPKQEAALVTEQDKIGYMIGMDIARAVNPLLPDIDLASFERACRDGLAGKPAPVPQDDAKALMPKVAERAKARATNPGQPVTLAPVDINKVGLIVGTDIAHSLEPFADLLNIDAVMRAVRDAKAGTPPALSAADIEALKPVFGQKVQERQQAAAAKIGAANLAEGAAFLAQNKTKPGVITTASGLQYQVLTPGAGRKPLPTDKVRVHYKGTLLDGTTFDSSYDRGEPTEFPLNQVIAGWTEGVGLMPLKSKYRFWIPAELAYGAKGTPGGPIGPNAVLMFDVELLDIL